MKHTRIIVAVSIVLITAFIAFRVFLYESTTANEILIFSSNFLSKNLTQPLNGAKIPWMFSLYDPWNSTRQITSQLFDAGLIFPLGLNHSRGMDTVQRNESLSPHQIEHRADQSAVSDIFNLLLKFRS